MFASNYCTIQTEPGKSGRMQNPCFKMSPKSKKAFPPSCSFYTTLHWTMRSQAMETWSSVWVAQWARWRDRDVPERFSSWFKQFIFFLYSEIKGQKSGNSQLIYFPNLKLILNSHFGHNSSNLQRDVLTMRFSNQLLLDVFWVQTVSILLEKTLQPTRAAEYGVTLKLHSI